MSGKGNLARARGGESQPGSLEAGLGYQRSPPPPLRGGRGARSRASLMRSGRPFISWPFSASIAADACNVDAMSVTDRCGDGVVMGGSYATDASALPLRAWGPLPRTGLRYPYALPTVGLRPACTMN